MSPIKWKDQTQQYSNGKDGFIRDICCFSIFWGDTSGGLEHPINLQVYLPGFKTNCSQRFPDWEPAQKYAELIWERFKERTGLYQNG